MKLAIAVTLLVAAPAFADKPSLAEAKSAVLGFHHAVLDRNNKPKAADPRRALDLAGAPFSYDGFDYLSMVDDSVQNACKKKWGAKGTVKAAELPAFLDCAAIAQWRYALDDNADWAEANPVRLAQGVQHYAPVIARLAKDHLVVISHYAQAGPAESWNIYGVTKQHGKIKIDTLIAVNVTYDE